jgi:hypothetical protein
MIGSVLGKLVIIGVVAPRGVFAVRDGVKL